MERYKRNLGTITSQEQDILANSKICVIGCGGLGGYVLEYLARIGVGTIIAIDGDNFSESNLNRQILSNENNLNVNKAEVAKKRISTINSEISVLSINEFLTEQNAEELIVDSQIVIDALDNIETRFIVAEACKKISIPFIYGAVEGWFGQVSIIFPDDDTIDKIYPDKNYKANSPSVVSFTPAVIASIQVSQAIKFLLNRGDLLHKKLLHVDLLENEFTLLNLEL